MIKSLAKSLTSVEYIRVIDLAMRRVVDNGMESYGKEDQNLFDKMYDIKHMHQKKYGRMT